MSDYDIGKAFEKIENELIASMIRNLSRHRAEESKLGIEWSQWQAEQLKALEVYKRKNSKRFTGQYNSINEHIRRALRDSYNDGGTKQERQILQAIKRGFKGKGKNKPAFTGVAETTGEFFKTNERKLNSLIKATTHDMEKAEIAVLRMANDRYRKIIFNAQVMANTGAGTYAKAVDMATKDFLSAGINCIQYRNGRRVNIKSYAEMALRTANKRAYLQGEGAKRQEWGIYTVILNKRGNPCPLCAPFVGRVFIDDVWSGGPKNGISPVTGVKYPLLSEAIKKGLYHPNCRDAHTTYFEGISTPPENSQYTADELDELAERYNNTQKQNYAQNEAERMERMSKFSLDKDNKRAYGARAEQWRERAEELEKTVENSSESGIIKNEDIQNPNLGKKFSDIIEISAKNEKVLDDIHSSLNDFVRKNKKEKATVLRLTDSKQFSQIGEHSKVELNNELMDLLKHSPKDSLILTILTHVHPDNTPFSGEDILKILDYKSIKALTLECFDGSQYIITRRDNKFSLKFLLYDKRSKIDEIYHEVADTKFPEAYDEKKWEKISLSFVTECAKQICKFFNLDFRRLK